ncbi:membrane protein insertase YidC [Tomitella biformata]|uniref:membrane protein insertase YidC n=1 Tax=Tomitella biformata TaxID=630403 RepID=UPI000467ED25|nr:membrane protein insertase YidC [Tomitella biformata]
MLNFIYWPVSAIMWVWYKLFSFVPEAVPGMGPTGALTWILAVVFLVFTLRAVLYWPAVKQIRTTRQMQELQPQIKALQKKYKNDRQRMATEMQKLQKEHGFNPLLGCLPMLAQAPVFIGLFHVLRSFNRTGTRFGQIDICGDVPNPLADNTCAELNASLGNYAFSSGDVHNFLQANIFGVPLSSYISQPAKEFAAFVGFIDEMPTRWQIAAVAIPLMIIAAVATYLNSRASVARQSPEAAAAPQAKIMNKLALYVFPLGVLVSGAFLPVAILLYWVANNGWTVVQQHVVFGQIEKEEEAKKQRLLEIRSERAPKPGAVPQVGKKAKPVDDVLVVDAEDSDEDDESPKPKPAAGDKPAGGAGGAQKQGGQQRNKNRSAGNRPGGGKSKKKRR